MFMDTDELGTWRDIEGVEPEWATPEWADGANDQPGTPPVPIATRIDGPFGVPYFDGLEDPFVSWEGPLLSSPNPLPWTPNEDVGAVPIVGAYDGAYRTMGPVQAWGLEPSGGMVDDNGVILMGDQAIGRIMRFPANIPERYDANGVYSGADYRDELVALIANGDLPIVSDAEVTTNLTLWPNVTQY